MFEEVIFVVKDVFVAFHVDNATPVDDVSVTVRARESRPWFGT